MKRIAFLGPEGTVSEESARYFFADTSVRFVPYPIISDVFAATLKGETDYGVIPIENTIEGSVSLHMDLLVEQYELSVQAEWVYPSRQNLLGHLEDWKDGGASIHTIFSHPVALGQCRKFLQAKLSHAKPEQVSSTAKGAALVKDKAGQGYAAIGTKLAAEKYGLDILAANIHDNPNNFTRFILVGKDKLKKSDDAPYKTSILVTLPQDYPGALHQVLSAFAWRKINLSRLESRPTKARLGSYYFYIDIEERMDSVLLPAAIQEIEAIGCQVRILGSYPSFEYNSEV